MWQLKWTEQSASRHRGGLPLWWAVIALGLGIMINSAPAAPAAARASTAGEETTITLPGGVPLALVLCPAGSFLMGSYPGEQEGGEVPQHHVTLTKAFYLGKYEVTKRQWTAVTGTAPWQDQADVIDDPDSPGVYVSWNDIAGPDGFIEKLNQHLAATGVVGIARLPTEAEWEYACRAGTTTRFYWGDDLTYSQIGQYAWWAPDDFTGHLDYAQKVGLKLPNAWGLYDMSGNVMEFCQDSVGDYPSGNVTDPIGPGSGAIDGAKVLRGGSYYDSDYCRSAAHYGFDWNAKNWYTGFRLALTIDKLPVIATISDATILDDQPYTGPTPVLTEGTTPITWSLVQGPAGLTINGLTGVVAWPTPRVDDSPCTITIRATNAYGSADASWRLMVQRPGQPSTPGGRLALTYCVDAPSTSTLAQPIQYTYLWTSDRGDKVTHGPITNTADTLTEMDLVQPGETWTVTVTPRAGDIVGLPATAKVRICDPKAGVWTCQFYQ